MVELFNNKSRNRNGILLVAREEGNSVDEILTAGCQKNPKLIYISIASDAKIASLNRKFH